MLRTCFKLCFTLILVVSGATTFGADQKLTNLSQAEGFAIEAHKDTLFLRNPLNRPAPVSSRIDEGSRLQSKFLVEKLLMETKINSTDLQMRAMGGLDSGGGFVLFCRSAEGPITYLPDYTEMIQFANGEKALLDFGPGLDFRSQVKFVLKRLFSFSPMRSLQYWTWFLEMWPENASYPADQIEWGTSGEIFGKPDFTMYTPVNCQLKRVIAQRTDADLTYGSKRYLINQVLWDQLNEHAKAGLILHELIYRENLAGGHTSSRPTMYFNKLISSTNLNPALYYDAIVRVGLSYGEIFGIKFPRVSDPRNSMVDYQQTPSGLWELQSVSSHIRQFVSVDKVICYSDYQNISISNNYSNFEALVHCDGKDNQFPPHNYWKFLIDK